MKFQMIDIMSLLRTFYYKSMHFTNRVLCQKLEARMPRFGPDGYTLSHLL